MKSLLKRLQASVLLVFCFVCMGCTSFQERFTIPNYQDFLKNLKQYEEELPKDIVPVIQGFEPIISLGFDVAVAFSGAYTYVEKDKQNYLLGQDGRLFHSPLNLSEKDLRYDKFIFSANGRLGLQWLDGSVCLDAKYTAVYFYENTVIACQNQDFEVYKNGEFVVKSTYMSDIALLNSQTIVLDGKLYNLELQRLQYQNYFYADIAHDGMILITDHMHYGYLSEDRKTLIPPQFDSASSFSNGFAITTLGNQTMAIDRTGNIRYQSASKRLHAFHDEHFCFQEDDLTGILNRNFQTILTPQAITVQGNRVFRHYIIDSTLPGALRFYDFVNRQYLPETYRSIEPHNFGLIVQNVDNTFSVLTYENETILADCTHVSYQNDCLLVGKDGMFYFYRINNRG